MPLYPFRCSQCGEEFEVSRKMSEASNPANCPRDGAAGTRIFTAPMRLTSRGVDEPPQSTGTAPNAADQWSHFGHSHGSGVGGHSHSHSHSHGAPPPTGAS